MRTCKWLAIVMLAACGGGGKKAAKTEPVAETTPPATSEPAKTEASAPVAPPAKAEPPQMTLAQKIAKTGMALVQGWNAHDPDMIAAQYEADASFMIPGMPELTGKDAIKAAAADSFAEFPDFKVVVTRAFMKDNVSVFEWVITGTQNGDNKMMNMKASKRPMGLHGVDVATYSDAGLIKTDHRYFDAPTEMSQLDAKAKKGTFRPVAELPTGEPTMLASKGGDDEQKSLDAVNGMYKAIETHKVDAVLAMMDKDVEGEDYSQPTSSKGTKAVKAYMGAFFKAVPDLTQKADVQLAAGNIVVTEGVLSGTLKGNLGPLKATKKPITLHFVDIIEVKDGKAAKVTSYANSMELMPPPAAPKADTGKKEPTKEPAKKPAK